MLSERHYRSAGACLGLLLCYYTSRSLERDGVVELACFWSVGCVAGAIVGQRVFQWMRP
ncbi:MAG: hypothetical protein VXZ38_02130 [Planctomycetota bacterium]|nr:hypothetical protein [Planctomycetota bacterium]